MKILFPFFIVLGVSLVSCQSAEDGRKAADKFFDHLIKEDYDAAAKLIDLNDPSIDEMAALKAFVHDSKYGEFKSYKEKSGFKTSMNNSVTTVAVPYELVYEKGTYQRTVELIDEGDGFKIRSIHE